MSNTNVMVQLSMYGDDFHPQDITDKLGIQPTEYWRKGENVAEKVLIRKNNCWRCSTGYQDSLDINEQVSHIMELFQGKTIEINELVSSYNLEIIISIVINIENNQKPAMYFNRQIIEFINLIKAEVDIDLYVYS